MSLSSSNQGHSPTSVRSISDDDLCSDCAHCRYSPGEMSGCAEGWPTPQGASEYVIDCSAFARVAAGTNLAHDD